MKIERVPQESVEIFISKLKMLGHEVSTVTVDPSNFMYLLVEYMAA